ISAEMLAKLERVRARMGVGLRISSGYRCPDYNAQISSTGRTGPHTTGRAVDVACYGTTALRLIEAALAEGFTGIGVSQKGEHAKRFIHLDDLKGQSRPWIWSY